MKNLRIIAILLNFKRPQNLPLVIDSIRKQSVPIKIMLWHNGVDDDIEGADWVIRSNRNMGCLARWYMATLVDADYYFTLDDDLQFDNHRLIENCIKISQSSGNKSIIGRSGTVIGNGMRKYSSRPFNEKFSKSEYTYVDIVKGRFMFVPASLLKLVPLVFEDYRGRGDDIWISLMTGKKKNNHILSEIILEGFKELPDLNEGLSKKGNNHYIKRDIIVAKTIVKKLIKWYDSTLVDSFNSFFLDIYALFKGIKDHRQIFSNKALVYINDGSFSLEELVIIRQKLMDKYKDKIQIIEWRYPNANGEPIGDWVTYSNRFFEIDSNLIAEKLFALSGSKEMYIIKKTNPKNYSLVKKSISRFKNSMLKQN